METTLSLPNQVCQDCVTPVMDFLPFLKICRESALKWNEIAKHLDTVSVNKQATTAYVLFNDEGPKTIADRSIRRKTQPPALKEVIKNVRYRLNHARYENKCKIQRARIKQQIKERKNFLCPECKRRYKTICKFNRHISNLRKQCCEHCYSIIDIASFGIHLRTHNIASFECRICSSHFETEEGFLKHKLIHKQGKFMCPDCKMTFPTMDGLTLHTNFRHSTKHCNNCNQIFTNKGCFLAHKLNCGNSRLTGPSQKFICDYCNKEFSNKTVIATHITYYHCKKKMYQCDKCGKQFSNAPALTEHSYSHDKILDRFTCEFCGQNYCTNGGYRKHLRKKHYKVDPDLYKKIRYQCHFCEQILISERNLERHIVAKHK